MILSSFFFGCGIGALCATLYIMWLPSSGGNIKA